MPRQHDHKKRPPTAGKARSGAAEFRRQYYCSWRLPEEVHGVLG